MAPSHVALYAIPFVCQGCKEDDAGDQDAEEAEVDHGDPELGETAAGVWGEGKNGPDGGEERDDEEAENASGGSGGGFGVLVDEVGEHAPYRD